MMWRLAIPLLLLASFPAAAHDGENHAEPGVSSEAAVPAEATTPFPADLDTTFHLVDSQGRAVSNADFEGRFLFVFFGFARCQGICPTAYRAMGEAAELLEGEGVTVQPLLITIDPENEPPAVLAEALPELHPRLAGLTGEKAAVEAVMAGFKVDAERKGTSALDGAPIFAHGSYIYLLGPGSELLTVLPPILGAERLAEITVRYVTPSAE